MLFKRFHAALRGKGLHSYSCARTRSGCSCISVTGRGSQSIFFRRTSWRSLRGSDMNMLVRKRYACAEEALRQLKERMNGEFPHEIGVFLGYPLGDVCGFLRDPDGCILCGAWKVYENVDEAARTFERFRRCSACICRHMDNGRSLTQIFNAG